MSRRHTRAKKRIKGLERLLRSAAAHIESAADIIEEEGIVDPEDGEIDEERAFAETLRRVGYGGYC